MEIHYLTIFIAAVISMILGGVWYGPLFGKKWMEIIGATETDIEKRKEMQKAAGPLYVVQFFLTLLQVYILAHFVQAWDGNGIGTAVWIWLGFIMPTLAAGAMWNNNPARVKWAMFLIQSGYYFLLFLIFGHLLGTWG